MGNYIIYSEKDGKQEFVIGFHAKSKRDAKFMFDDIEMKPGYRYNLCRLNLIEGKDLNGIVYVS